MIRRVRETKFLAFEKLYLYELTRILFKLSRLCLFSRFRASRDAISRIAVLCFDCKHSMTDYSAPFDAS